jgi:hypothetical protein
MYLWKQYCHTDSDDDWDDDDDGWMAGSGVGGEPPTPAPAPMLSSGDDNAPMLGSTRTCEYRKEWMTRFPRFESDWSLIDGVKKAKAANAPFERDAATYGSTSYPNYCTEAAILQNGAFPTSCAATQHTADSRECCSLNGGNFFMSGLVMQTLLHSSNFNVMKTTVPVSGTSVATPLVDGRVVSLPTKGNPHPYRVCVQGVSSCSTTATPAVGTVRVGWSAVTISTVSAVATVRFLKSGAVASFAYQLPSGLAKSDANVELVQVGLVTFEEMVAKARDDNVQKSRRWRIISYISMLVSLLLIGCIADACAPPDACSRFRYRTLAYPLFGVAVLTFIKGVAWLVGGGQAQLDAGTKFLAGAVVVVVLLGIIKRRRDRRLMLADFTEGSASGASGADRSTDTEPLVLDGNVNGNEVAPPGDAPVVGLHNQYGTANTGPYQQQQQQQQYHQQQQPPQQFYSAPNGGYVTVPPTAPPHPQVYGYGQGVEAPPPAYDSKGGQGQ